MADEQVSLTSLIVIVVVGGLIIRYLFFSPATPTIQPTRDAQAAARDREAIVQRVQAVCPQADRRTILWNLQRARWNADLVAGMILSRQHETPPVTFQPPPAPASPTPPSTAQTPSKAPPKPAEPDLIARYKLQSKINAENESESTTKTKAWSSNRDERHATLQRRRDEMIIAARRKMEAKIAAERAVGNSQQ